MRALSRFQAIVTAAVATLALSGCGPGAGVGGVGGGGPEKKLNAYVSAYNGVTQSSLGLVDQYKRYVELDIPHERASESIVIQPDWVGDKLEPLKAARTLPGGPPELDAAGDRLIATLTPMIARFEGLKTYYESRKYSEDALARGKAEDAPMKAQFKAALEAADGLAAAIEVEQGKRDDALLARLKAKGDLIGYDELTAMNKARALVRLFKRPQDLKDPAAFARGDAVVAELEPLLEDGRARIAKAPKGDGHDRNTYFNDSMNDLTKVIGAYRTLKAGHDPSDAENMVTQYNFAIQSMNSAAS